jgi:DNA-binding response OmpR family regulator
MALELTAVVPVESRPDVRLAQRGAPDSRRSLRLRGPYHPEPASEPERAVAFVIASRPYAVMDVVTGLFANGFSAIERGYDEIVPLLREFSPTLIVAAMDPLQDSDMHMIATLAEDSHAFLLLLAPSSESFAAGLTSGADACLSDSDGADVLSAQFRSIRRRISLWDESRQETHATIGPLAIDFEACKVTYAGRTVSLTPMEYSILAHLAHHRGAVCSPVKIVYAVLGDICDERTAAERIKAFIWRIRVKLKDAGAADGFVRNFRGVGYLVDDATRANASLPA